MGPSRILGILVGSGRGLVKDMYGTCAPCRLLPECAVGFRTSSSDFRPIPGLCMRGSRWKKTSAAKVLGGASLDVGRPRRRPGRCLNSSELSRIPILPSSLDNDLIRPSSQTFRRCVRGRRSRSGCDVDEEAR